MSLKRTPPNKTVVEKNVGAPTSAAPDSRLSHQSGSFPDLTSLSQDSNITNRSKRKREICECVKSLEEIRTLLSTSTTKTEEKFAALLASILEISAQNCEIQKSMEFISKDYDDLKLKLAKLESEREADRRYVLDLEEKVENMERQLCSTKIEIRNVPQMQEESKESLRTIVVQASNVLGIPISGNEIKDVFRTKNKNNSSTITVDFMSSITKDNIIKKARRFNSANNQSKLSTTHLKLDGPNRPIYISEKLTPKSQKMYYLARRFAENNAYKYCWTSYGKVLLRKMDGERYIVIKSETDLDGLLCNK
ncbi:hypothetical protein PYW07_001277 [Mythimna separata]|uniref:FP protein C-terminal domain-containing protein n=1 Tax=Mythimna separata TaxID=271217 RepID=A0AAD8DVT3_MYTSE|nr:hypothetical protein PYW07_001277 [Mythimna separata]